MTRSRAKLQCRVVHLDVGQQRLEPLPRRIPGAANIRRALRPILGHLTSASGVTRKLWNQTSPSISLSDAVRAGMISCSHWALQSDTGTLKLTLKSVQGVVTVTGVVSATNACDSAQEICQTAPLSVRRLDALTANSRS